MICEATSLKKYIDKSPRLFFVYGPEIILKNDSIDHIIEFYKKHGFTEKKAIFDKDFKDIDIALYWEYKYGAILFLFIEY